MKIGIATFWDTPVNYGQVLQGYALEESLKDMGCESFIIKYTMGEEVRNDSFKKKIMRVLKGERTLRQLLRRFVSKGQYSSERGFMSFKERYIAYSPIIYNSFDEIAANVPLADLYMTGSDQVWGAWGSDNKKRVFLLDFLPDNAKRISYGSSFGRTSLTPSEKAYFKKCLSRYSAISVREQQGEAICRDLGVNAKVVIDPTLLLDYETWNKRLGLKGLDCKYKVRKKFVFAYSVTNDENNKNFYCYLDYLKSVGYDVVYVSSTNYLDKNATFEPTIEEWLWHIRHACLVITNSFHGIAFSLNFNTPFLALTKGMNASGEDTRLLSLLKKTRTDNRLMSVFDKDSVQSAIDKVIGWEDVNKVLEHERKESIEFLNQSIYNCSSLS